MRKPLPKKLRMPVGWPLKHLAWLEGDTLTLCVPMTPTQNTRDRWHFGEKARFRDAVLTTVMLEAALALGANYPRPWAQRVELTIIRCSSGTVQADDDGVVGGAKDARDTLLLSRPKRPGAGLVVDDGPAHLTIESVEDRPRGHWRDRPGPGTWLILKKIA